MTPGDLPTPPEGKLIRSARERSIPKVTIRTAAARIGISPEHWGNIERGYKSVSADEPPVRVEASAELMAKMAAVVGVAPEQMASEGQRPDAAALIHAVSPARATPPRLPRATPEMQKAMAGHLARIKELVAAAERDYPGQQLTGAMIFPRDEAAAAWWWDRIAASEAFEPEDIPSGVAAQLAWDDQEAQLRESGYATG